MQLTDAYGRTISSLRISLTQRCNLKCIYCHHEGDGRGAKNEMSAQTVANIVEASKIFGINKVKFSGGEPLMRDDFENVIATLPALKEISATTNGTFLSERAISLAESGLSRVNISLPTLSSEKYRKLTGGDISRVLKGVDAAVECLSPVKLNMVLLRGINDDEIINMMDFTRKYEGKVILQLIELMYSQKTSKYKVNINEIEKFLESKASEIKERKMHRRKKYYIDGMEVELVSPIDNSHFCANCTRLRITSDGKLKPCLLRNDNLIDVNNKKPHEIVELLELAVSRREPFYKD